MFKKIFLVFAIGLTLLMGFAFAFYIDFFGSEEKRDLISDGSVTFANNDICFGGYQDLSASGQVMLTHLSIQDSSGEPSIFDPNKEIPKSCFKLKDAGIENIKISDDEAYLVFYSVLSKANQQTKDYAIQFCKTNKNGIAILNAPVNQKTAFCRK